MPLAFPKNHRLLTPSDFKVVFNDARKVISPHLVCLFKNNESPHAKIGFALTKKKLPLAVTRNRLRRVIRESFRQQTTLPCIDIVILARVGLGEVSRQTLSQEMEGVWQRLCKKA